MQIERISLVQLLGIINFSLLMFQLCSGQHWIQVKVGIHRKVGLALVATASLHGLLAILN
ncbi:MAG: hypothetical protein ACYC2W_08330 [Desulfurivibrionaceae bacterium]